MRTLASVALTARASDSLLSLASRKIECTSVRSVSIWYRDALRGRVRLKLSHPRGGPTRAEDQPTPSRRPVPAGHGGRLEGVGSDPHRVLRRPWARRAHLLRRAAQTRPAAARGRAAGPRARGRHFRPPTSWAASQTRV